MSHHVNCVSPDTLATNTLILTDICCIFKWLLISILLHPPLLPSHLQTLGYLSWFNALYSLHKCVQADRICTFCCILISSIEVSALLCHFPYLYNILYHIINSLFLILNLIGISNWGGWCVPKGIIFQFKKN